MVPCSQDLYVAEALSTLESWRSRYNQVVKDKGDLELEIIVLNEYVCLEEGTWAIEGKGHTRRVPAPSQLLCSLTRQGLHWAEVWQPWPSMWRGWASLLTEVQEPLEMPCLLSIVCPVTAAVLPSSW